MLDQTHLPLLQEDCRAGRWGAETWTKLNCWLKWVVSTCRTDWALGLGETHHSRVEIVWLYGWGGHRAEDSLLFLPAVAEPDAHHLLLHGQLLWDQRNLLWVRLGVLQGHIRLLVGCWFISSNLNWKLNNLKTKKERMKERKNSKNNHTAGVLARLK